MALRQAEAKAPSTHYHLFTCVVLAALSIEAIANAVGTALFDKHWSKHERHTPHEKIQLLYAKCGIPWQKDREPCSTVIWLSSLRNDLAHPKPELLSVEKIMSEVEWEAVQLLHPKAKLEREFTLGNASRALSGANALLQKLVQHVPSYKRLGLIHEGGKFFAEVLPDTVIPISLP